MDFIEIIPNLVNGFEIEKGSTVLLNFWGENSNLHILDKLAIEITKLGAIPIRLQQSREYLKTYFEEVSEEYLTFPDTYKEIFKLASTVIDIFMYSPSPHRDFPKDKLNFYRSYMGNLFNSLVEGKEVFIQVRVPTEENAASEGIEYDVYNNSIYEALSIDFKKLKARTTELVDTLKDSKQVTIYSKDNNALSFSIENRQWYKDDGTGDIPCGEVFIAPIEDSAQGKILIPQVIIDSEKYFDVILEFKDGKLASCSSPTLLEYIKSFPGDNDLIAEFGIGLNENVKNLIGCAVIDEKCIGTAHIAIGMNDLFGGKNSSPLHLDFIFQPVKIYVDDSLLMDGGKLLL